MHDYLRGSDITLPDLDAKIKEADMMMISHSLHAVNCGATKDVLLSNDTDVMILVLHYWNTLKGCGLKELWMIHGVRNTTWYNPLHTLADTLCIQSAKSSYHFITLMTVIQQANMVQKQLVRRQIEDIIFVTVGKDSNDFDCGLVEQFLFSVYNFFGGASM